MDARWMHGVTSSQTNCKNPVRNGPWRDEGQAFLDLPNSQGGLRRFSWEPAKPRPNQTTSPGPSSAAIGSTSSAERKPTDTRRAEETIGANEEAVGREKEGGDETKDVNWPGRLDVEDSRAVIVGMSPSTSPLLRINNLIMNSKSKPRTVSS